MTVSLTKLVYTSNCDECFSTLISSEGWMVCHRCGLVHEKIMSQDNTFNVKSPSPLSYCSLTKTYKHIRKVRSLNNVIYNDNLNYYHLLPDFVKICEHLGFTETAKDRAHTLFKQLMNDEVKYKKQLKMRFISNYLAFVSIFRTSKERNIIISFQQLTGAFKTYNKRLSIPTVNEMILFFNLKTRFTVSDYINKFEAKLRSIYPELIPRTKEVLELAKLKRQFQGSNPRVFASACLYVIYHLLTKQRVKCIVKTIAEINGTPSGMSVRVLGHRIISLIECD